MCRDCGCSSRSLILNQNTDDFLNETINFKNIKSVSVQSPSLHSESPTQINNLRKISVEESIFQKNLTLAKKNELLFTRSGLRVFNFMSSPGSGKTTLLTKVLPLIKEKVLVLVGDQETNFDADRLNKAGLNSIQINTNSSCHLDAERIAKALPENELINYKYLIIENVGNLVCPAAFSLGEQFKVAVLSVTEGEEKPLKYPLLFEDAHLIVITKIDLLPYLNFDQDLLISNIRKKNIKAKIIFVSSQNGNGIEELKSELENPTCV
jgi:hydrogenase nickel incorporation protein HypB